jgi:hypothetical protein
MKTTCKVFGLDDPYDVKLFVSGRHTGLSWTSTSITPTFMPIHTHITSSTPLIFEKFPSDTLIESKCPYGTPKKWHTDVWSKTHLDLQWLPSDATVEIKMSIVSGV